MLPSVSGRKKSGASSQTQWLPELPVVFPSGFSASCPFLKTAVKTASSWYPLELQLEQTLLKQQ